MSEHIKREAAPRLEDQAGQGEAVAEVCAQPDPTTTTELSADTSAVIAFLRALRPDGPWVLWARQADGPANECRTFGADEADALARWIAERNGARWNYYYHPNPTRGPMSRKASKADIAAVEFLHADLDPRAGEDVDEERARILRLLGAGRPEGVPEPTAIVSSGGGYNALWRLDEAVPLGGPDDAAELERYTRGIEALLADADSTHNVDRVLRLPGTVNWPDERKRRRGRAPALAEVVAMAAGRAYPLSAFPAAPPKGETADAPTVSVDAGAVRRCEGVDDPRLDRVSDLAKVVIVQGCDPDDPQRFAKPGTSELDRSAALFFACCEMVRAGCDDATMYAVITDPGFGVSASVLDKGSRTHAYATRQIEQARAEGADLVADKNGRPYPTPANVRLALDKLGVELEHDCFADRSYIHGLPDFGPVLSDAALTRLWLLVEERYQLVVGKDRFWSIAADLAMHNRRHPVLEYLDSLSWDGAPRIDRWLVEYMGAPDTPFVRAVGAIVLLAAVRRVRQPGCKFDEMLVLEGPQGRGKSTALSILAVEEDWFSDDLPLGTETKRIIEATAGRWIVEAGELRGMRKSEIEAIKSLLSRRVDRARLAYGRLTTEIPRQFVIVGTTNSERYLRDNTGNRRFWPVLTGDIDLAGLRHDRDQLWAEAAAREAEGESIRLDRSLYGDAAGVQDARRVEDPFLERLGAALGDIEGQLRAEDAWKVVGVPAGQRSQEHNARLGDAMRELGWDRVKKRFGGAPTWAYVRGDGPKLVVAGEVGGDIVVHAEGELP